ncbi:MAG: YbjN domain-containing protein [Acidobacteriota bacterium]
MNRKIIYAVLVILTLFAVQAAAQVEITQTQIDRPKPKAAPPKPKTLIEQVKELVAKAGATVDESKSSPAMVVSNYLDPKTSLKTNIVILQSKNKTLLSFYIYNFGNVRDLPNKDEVYRYLLSTNDKISIGSFFVDDEDDIGYKYIINVGTTITKSAFDTIYLSMLATEREHKPEIRKLLGLEPDKPLDPKKAAEDKPPTR